LVSAILNYCYSEISLFMISYQLGNQAVGVYAVGYRIMVYACLLIDIVTQVSFKQFSDEYHQKQSYRSMMIVLG
jgi:O-antigen/teichoic acid export membrane protein